MVEFTFFDFLRPIELVRTYWLLRRSEQWRPSQFRQYQNMRLSRLLSFCANQVPYYSRLFKNTGLDPDEISPQNSRSCLEQLPILEKDVLRETPELFLARGARRFNPKPVSTSGTTGTPLTIYWDRGSNVMEICSIQRFWRWAGFRVGQPFLDLRSRTFSGHENHLVKGDGVLYIYNWKANGLEFSSDLIERSNILKYNQVLLRHRPGLVRGHPQAIQHLANLLREEGCDDWRPRVVTTNAETLYEFQRQEIRHAWDVPVLDWYGQKEHCVSISQCREGTYHLSPVYGICEILDDQGKPVMPGQEGWIVGTGLHNLAQPLLRYKTRDRAVAGRNLVCSCGRTMPTVERIIGRIDDCIQTSDGKRYSGMSFPFLGRRGIRKARLIQEDSDTVTVEIVVAREFDQAERVALLDALKRKVDHKMTFRVKIVDDIVQETPGKFKFVVSKLKNPQHSIPLDPSPPGQL
jgi:phenylacetate-CoA ligase